jgi:5-methylcytosine-specific restriction endonuclease McrA
MPDVAPDPKPVTEGGIGRPKPKGRARTHRTTWRELHARRGGPCWLCGAPKYELHHLWSRARGGPDEAWNLAPLCRDCHRDATDENPATLRRLAAALDDESYAGLIERGSEGIVARLFGV